MVTSRDKRRHVLAVGHGQIQSLAKRAEAAWDKLRYTLSFISGLDDLGIAEQSS